MTGLARFLNRHGMRLLIALKVGVLAYVLAAHTGLVYWGEKPLSAEEAAKAPAPADAKDAKDAKETKDAAPAKAAASESGATPAIRTKVPAIIEGDAPAEAEAAKPSAEKSFLDRLFDLPKVNSSALKKEEVGRYLALMEQKERQVKERMRVLKEQEAQLGELEKSIDTKIKKLEDEAAFFKQTQQKEKELQDERLAKLVDFYQKMAPKKAAPVFEKLDKDLVVALWKKFPEKQTTQILSLMDPQKSVELSEYFGRIRSAKEYDMMKEINADLRKEFANCKQAPTVN